MTEFKILAELNVQPGDVVECVDNHAAHGSLTIGGKYTIGDCGCPIDDQGGQFPWSYARFRIISRAKPATDLTTLTVPVGLLDEVYGPGTKSALIAHGGLYIALTDEGWEDQPEYDDAYSHWVWRIKPTPMVGKVVVRWHTVYGFAGEDGPNDPNITHSITLPTIDSKFVAGTYTGPDGLQIVVESLK